MVRMRSMADMIELQELRKRVEELEEYSITKEDEEYIRVVEDEYIDIVEEEFAIIAEVAEEIKQFTDNESIIDIVEFIVAIATGDYEIIEDVEIIDDLEEVDNEDPWRYR